MTAAAASNPTMGALPSNKFITKDRFDVEQLEDPAGKRGRAKF
jgi:hypothetical protein